MSNYYEEPDEIDPEEAEQEWLDEDERRFEERRDYELDQQEDADFGTAMGLDL